MEVCLRVCWSDKQLLIAFFKGFNIEAHLFRGPKDRLGKNFGEVESDERDGHCRVRRPQLCEGDTGINLPIYLASTECGVRGV